MSTQMENKIVKNEDEVDDEVDEGEIEDEKLPDGQYRLRDGNIVYIPDMDRLIFSCKEGITRQDIRRCTDEELADLIMLKVWDNCCPGNRCNWSKSNVNCNDDLSVVLIGSDNELVSACGYCANEYSDEYEILMKNLSANSDAGNSEDDDVEFEDEE